MTKEEFVNAMVPLVGYYDVILNEYQKERWFKIFEKTPSSTFSWAIDKYFRDETSTRFPAPGRINGIIFEKNGLGL